MHKRFSTFGKFPSAWGCKDPVLWPDGMDTSCGKSLILNIASSVSDCRLHKGEGHLKVQSVEGQT